MSDFLNGRLIYVYRDEEKTLDATYSLALPTIDGAIISAVKKPKTPMPSLHAFSIHIYKKKLPSQKFSEARNATWMKANQTRNKRD